MDPKPLDPLDAHRKLHGKDASPEASEASKSSALELARRVKAATAVPAAPVVDVFTGKKLCHRFFHFVQTEAPNPLNAREIQVRSNLVNVGCLGSKCSLWDDENKRCLDVSEKLATVETSKTLEVIDGLLRMLHDAQ